MRAHPKPAARRSLVLYVMVSVSFCLVLFACRSDKPPEAEHPQRYELKGKVVSVDPAEKQLVVDHEAIPNFMGAMTMPYTVKDERLLQGLSAGDQVTAQVVAAGEQGVWLENIVVVEKATPSSPGTAGK